MALLILCANISHLSLFFQGSHSKSYLMLGALLDMLLERQPIRKLLAILFYGAFIIGRVIRAVVQR